MAKINILGLIARVMTVYCKWTVKEVDIFNKQIAYLTKDKQ